MLENQVGKAVKLSHHDVRCRLEVRVLRPLLKSKAHVNFSDHKAIVAGRNDPEHNSFSAFSVVVAEVSGKHGTLDRVHFMQNDQRTERSEG